jgi:hypothetical protein
MILEESKPASNFIDFFFLGIEITILFISIIKCAIFSEGKMFVVVGGMLSSMNGGIVFDSIE